jgi:hypothetical protein
MTPKGADLAATDLIEVSTLEAGSYVTKSITGQELIDAIPLPPTGLTVGTTPISSGTVGRVLFEGTGNVLQQSANLFWDSTNNRLGIGTSSPTVQLDVRGSDTSFIKSNLGVFDIGFGSANRVGLTQNIVGYSSTMGPNGAGGIRIGTGTSYAYLSAQLTALILNGGGGNVLIGTTTDAGFRLDVNGTARVKGTGTTSSTTAFTVQNSAGTNMLQLRDDNYQLFGSWLAMESSRYIYKANNATGILTLCNDSTVASFVNLYGSSHATLPNVIDFGTASTSRMVINAAGNVGIGTTSPTSRIHVSGLFDALPARILRQGTYGEVIRIGRNDNSSETASIHYPNDGVFAINTVSNERMRINASGNVLINTTTDAGYKLDVNGTARVSGDVTSTGSFITTSRVGFSNNSRTITFDDANSGILHQGFGGHRFQSYNGSSYVEMFTIVGNQANLRIGINSTTPNASAVLDVVSTDKGFLPPRMTTTQRNAIASPAAGLMVYDTTLNAMFYFNGTIWI